MDNNLTAEQYTEILLESIQTLINGSIDELKFDHTEVCTVLSTPEDVTFPYELTLDGTNIIEAYGETLNYVVGEQVLVSFPKDDTKHKTILSRYNTEENEIKYIRPGQHFAEAARGVHNGPITIYASDGNRTIKYISLTDSAGESAGGAIVGLNDIYNQIGTFNAVYLKTTISTNFNDFSPKGNYGLLVNVSMKDSSYDFTFTLDSSDMLGNPYAFEGGYDQEILYHFDIPNNQPIDNIEIYAYWLGNFMDEESITFSNTQLSVGFDTKLVEDNTVILYSHEPQEYNVGPQELDDKKEDGEAVIILEEAEELQKDTVKTVQLMFLNKDNNEKFLGFNKAGYNPEQAKQKRGKVISINSKKEKNDQTTWIIAIEGVDSIYKCTNSDPCGLEKWEKNPDTKVYEPVYRIAEKLSVGNVVTYSFEPVTEGSSLQRFAYIRKLSDDDSQLPDYYCIDWEMDNPYGVYTIKESKNPKGWSLEKIECQETLIDTRIKATVWYNGESYTNNYTFKNAGVINNADMLQGGIGVKIKHGPYSESNYPLYDGNSLQLIGSGKHTLRELHFGYNVGETRINDLYWDESPITWEPQGAMLVAEPAQATMYYFDPAEIIEVEKNGKSTEVQKYIYGILQEDGSWKTPEDKEITDIKSTGSEIVGGDFDELVRDFFEKNEEDKSIVIKEDVEYCLRYNEEKEVYQLLGLKSSMVGNLVNAKYYYRVEEFFNPSAINENSITCTVNIPTKKGGEVLSYAQDSDTVNFSFATFGASGTDYTIMFNRQADIIYMKLVDKSGKLCESSMQYRWFGEDNTWAAVSSNTDEKAEDFPYCLNFADTKPSRSSDDFNLLEVRASVTWQNNLVWVKGIYSVITPYGWNEKTNKPQYSFDVPYTIIYDNQGTNPQWSNNSLAIYDENGAPVENLTWSIHDYSISEPISLPWRKSVQSATPATETQETTETETYTASIKPPIDGKIVLRQGEMQENWTLTSGDGKPISFDTNNEAQITQECILIYTVPANTYDWRNSITATIYGTYNDSGVTIVTDDYGKQYITVPKLLLKGDIRIALEAGGFNIPIYVGINPYGLATLNEWDGSLVIDNDNNYILSAMMGAGHKNTDNTFTGVAMGDYGKLQGNNVSNNRTGLFGFDAGVQTFELNTNGTATLGRAGSGQIIFDGNQGLIKSNGWTTSNKSEYTLDTRTADSGTIIDLDDAIIVMEANSDNNNYIKFNNGNSGKLEIKASAANITFTDQENNSLATIITSVKDGISMSLNKAANYYGICSTANNDDPGVNSNGSINKNILTKTVGLKLDSNQTVDTKQIFKDGVTIAVTFQHPQDVERFGPYTEVTLHPASYEKNKYYIKDTITEKYILCTDDTFDSKKTYYEYSEPTYKGKELYLKIGYDKQPDNSFVHLGTHPIYLNGVQTGENNPFGWGEDEQGATIFFTFVTEADRANPKPHWEVVDSGSYNRSIWTDKQFSREIADTNAGIGSLISQTAGEIRAEVRRTANYYGECSTEDNILIKEVRNLTRVGAGNEGSLTGVTNDELFQKGVTIAITFTDDQTVSTEYYEYLEIEVKADNYIPNCYYTLDNNSYILDSNDNYDEHKRYYTKSILNNPTRTGKTLNLQINGTTLPIYIKGAATSENNPFSWDAGSTIYFVYDYTGTINNENTGFWRVGDSGSYSKIIETADGIYTEVGTENGRLQSAITQTARNIRMEVASKANYSCIGTISKTTTAQWDIDGIPDNTELKPGCALMITFKGAQTENTTDTNITFKIKSSGSEYVVSGSPVWKAEETLPFVILDEMTVAMTSISSAQLDITTEAITSTVNRTGGYACTGTADATTKSFIIELMDTSDPLIELEKTGVTINVFFNDPSYSTEIAYTEIEDTSIVKYKPNVYYYYTDELNDFILSNENGWDAEQTYYKKTTTKECETISFTCENKEYSIPVYYRGSPINASNPFYWDEGDTVFFSYVPALTTESTPYWMVVDSGSQSKSIQTADMIAQVVEDVEGNYSAIIQTADRIESEVGKTIKRYTCTNVGGDYYQIDGATQEEYDKIITTVGTEFMVSFGATEGQTDPSRQTIKFVFIGSDGEPLSSDVSVITIQVPQGTTWDANETLAFRVGQIKQNENYSKAVGLILTQASSSKITQTKEAITSEVRRTAGYACIATQVQDEDYEDQNIELWALSQISDAQGKALTVEDICLPGVTLAVTFNNYSSKEDNKDQWSYYLQYSDGKNTVNYPIYVRGEIAGTDIDTTNNRVINPLSWETNDTLFLSFFEPSDDNAGGWRVVDSGAYSKIQQTADSIKATVIEELGDEFATVEMTKDMITNTVGTIIYTGTTASKAEDANKIVVLDNEENLTAADIFIKGRQLAVIFESGNLSQTDTTLRKLKVRVRADKDDTTPTEYEFNIYYQDKDGIKEGLFPLEKNTKVYFTYYDEKGPLDNQPYWVVGGGEYSVLQQTRDNFVAQVMNEGEGFGWNLTSDSFKLYTTDETTTSVTKKTVFCCDKDGVTVTGNINATSGSIGGWVLNSFTVNNASHGSLSYNQVGDANSIYLSTYYTSNDSATSGSVAIGGSDAKEDWRFTIGQNFGVDSGGKLYAKDANISGRINANGGSIGGWTITTTGDNYNAAGALNKSIYREDGTWRGRLTISPGDLGTEKNVIHLQDNDLSGTMVPFYVTGQGKLCATGAQISGEVTITKGTFDSLTAKGNLNIGAQKIYFNNNSGNDYLQYNSSKKQLAWFGDIFHSPELACTNFTCTTLATITKLNVTGLIFNSREVVITNGYLTVKS